MKKISSQRTLDNDMARVSLYIYDDNRHLSTLFRRQKVGVNVPSNETHVGYPSTCTQKHELCHVVYCSAQSDVAVSFTGIFVMLLPFVTHTT